jgi:hypothetical protein
METLLTKKAEGEEKESLLRAQHSSFFKKYVHPEKNCYKVMDEWTK